MGSNQSQSISSNQKILTSIIQNSEQQCKFSCNNNLSDFTVIVGPGGEIGDINVSQVCAIEGVECIMQSSFDGNLETILESMASQQASAMNGFAINFANINQDVDLNQLITNSITQVQKSSCDFSAGNNIDNVYFYVGGTAGDINLSQNSSISNSTCNMDNLAKATSYSEATSETSQESKVTVMAGMFFFLIILGIVIMGIIIVVFLFTGGVGKISSSGGKEK